MALACGTCEGNENRMKTDAQHLKNDDLQTAQQYGIVQGVEIRCFQILRTAQGPIVNYYLFYF